MIENPDLQEPLSGASIFFQLRPDPIESPPSLIRSCDLEAFLLFVAIPVPSGKNPAFNKCFAWPVWRMAFESDHPDGGAFLGD